MQHQDNQTVTAQAQMDDDEINLMDLLLVVAKHNRFIIKLTASVAVLAVTISLIMPNIYTAKTVILPPQQGASTASMLLGSLGGLAGLAGGAAGIKSPNDLHIGMLKSRTVADKMIARFKLQQKFKAKTLEATRKALAGATVAGASAYNVTLSSITGYLEHVIENKKLGALTNMTAKCALTASSAIAAPTTASPATVATTR